MSTDLKRGSLIVFEGLDRTGKSTQCQILEKKLKNFGHQVESIRFPDRTTIIGKMIDSYLRQDSELNDQVIHLLFCANRWEKSEEINLKLNSGQIIICDRYAFSGSAFTLAKLKVKQSKELKSILDLTNSDKGLPLPDLIIFLKLDNQSTIQQRQGFGLERYENQNLQQEVERQFQHVVKPFFQKNHGSNNWVEVDASGSIEQVEQRIWVVIEEHLKNFVHEQPVGKLWMD